MKYTNYFAGKVNESGPLNLSQKHFKTLMNIVHLEGSKAGIEKVKKQFSKIESSHKYDFLVSKIDDQLKVLTNDLEPNALFLSWFH